MGPDEYVDDTEPQDGEVTPVEVEKAQVIRNKVYAVISGLLGVLVVVGVVDQATSDTLVGFMDQASDLVAPVAGLVSSILAWAKSRPSKVATVRLD